MVGDAIGVELAGLEYQKRLSMLLEHRIGLWDVIAEARRIGSLDSEIRDHANNDLLALLNTLPELTTIAFNGGTAAKIGLKALGARADNYRILLLPSSSPAHVINSETDLYLWMIAWGGIALVTAELVQSTDFLSQFLIPFKCKEGIM